MENTELMHHGIKGMKWGIRRFQRKDGSLTPAGKKRYSDDGDVGSDKGESTNKQTSKGSTSGSSKPKTVSEMSDDEIRQRLNRMQLEDQYNAAMAKRNPDKYQRAKKIVADLAEQTVRNLATKTITKAIDDAFKKKDIDSITSIADLDVSALGDKKLQQVLKRATMEQQLRKILGENLPSSGSSEKANTSSKSSSSERSNNSANTSRDNSNVNRGRTVVNELLALPAPRQYRRRER